MNGWIWAISIIGALAVASFIGFLAVRTAQGREALASRLLYTAAALGVVCGALGALMAFLD